jgi:sugar lactone lactonase YvrE
VFISLPLRRRLRSVTVLSVFISWTLVGVGSLASAAEVEFTPVRQVGGTGHAGLYAWGAATAPDGSVYIGDYWNYRIQHYAKDGTLLGTVVPKRSTGVGAHGAPYGIGVDPRNGDVYFGDVDSNATVDKYSASGQFLMEFGGLGTGPGRFTYPSRVAVAPDGLVVVSDSRANKLSVWNGNGTFRFERLGVESGSTVLSRPRGIDFDAAGDLYVADSRLQKVQVFRFNAARTALNLVRSFGIKKTQPGPPAPGELGKDLRGLSVDDAHGWVYVVDSTTGFVAKFTSGGTFLAFLGGTGGEDGEFSGGGRDITVDGDGNIWVGDMPNFRAQKFDANGSFLLKVPDPPQPPPPGGFSQPFSVASDAQGNIFVTDTFNWRIQKFDSAGNFVTQWGSRGSGATQFNYAKGIAVDRTNGDVVVADTDGHAIKRFRNDGTFRCMLDAPGSAVGQVKNPFSLDVASDGRIYVADSQNARVQVLETVTLSGGACTIRPRAVDPLLGSRGNGNGQFQITSGIAVDTDGSLWVSDRILGRVTHLSNSGVFLGRFGDGIGSSPTQFMRAGDVEVDASYVYVSDADANRIKVWRKDGTFVRAIGTGGSALGQFQRPQGLDMLPNGHLLVAEQTNERVQEFAIGYNVNPETNKPTGQMLVPTAGQALAGPGVTISGTAGDDSGVLTAQVAIKNSATGTWWTGNGWGSFTWLGCSLSASGPGATSATWSFAWTAPSTGTYAVQGRIQDVWANIGAISLRSFRVT